MAVDFDGWCIFSIMLLLFYFSTKSWVIQGAFAYCARKVERFWHVLSLDDSCKNVNNVIPASKHPHIFFKQNDL